MEKITQLNAPIFDAIQQHILRNPRAFHVPGHQMGTAFDSEGLERFSTVLPLDLTEITGLDDLHQPMEAIKQAQQLAADCFSADETFFLVNGSTVGNIAMIMASCQPGDKLIMPRNVHKSVIHACLLGRIRPIYLSSRVDLELGVPTSPSVENIEEALIRFPDAKAVFLTNPNYYGMGTDLAKVSELVHRYDKIVLVDEAHGAHFGFNASFPPSAMQQGCDASVQSTHKMLPALTMGSMLHVKGNRIDRSKVKQLLGMLQTSSPSYLILSSLDLARRYVWEHGSNRLGQVSDWTKKFASEINATSHLFTVPRSGSTEAYDYLDPCKITIHSTNASLSGYELKKLLEKDNIFVEMADMSNVVCVCSVGMTIDRLDELKRCLRKIEDNFLENCQKKQEEQGIIANIPLPPLSCEGILTMDEVMNAPHYPTLLQKAIGYVCAEQVIPYPPGIPIISFGEIITEPIVDYILALKSKGATFQGVQDPSLQTIKTVRSTRRHGEDHSK